MYIKKQLTKLKRQIGSSTIIAGDLNTLFSIMYRTYRQKIIKEIEELNNTINQLDLADVYRTLYSTAAESILFSSTLGTFSRIDHVLRHKTSQ